MATPQSKAKNINFLVLMINYDTAIWQMISG
ncbi:hypothetical protein EMGBS4_09350 [Acidimicrobiaceae bacterium]|nr:hypothetical protein EMGBS4_09350 [Acidimicrobiaceae bacterium]